MSPKISQISLKLNFIAAKKTFNEILPKFSTITDMSSLVIKALLFKYIFSSVTDIDLEVCGQEFHLKRALLAELINTYFRGY
jgi:hypothetical protein